MIHEKTGTERMLQECEMSMAREMVANSPEYRREKIARHYLSLAKTALTMMRVIRVQRHFPSEDARAVLDQFERDIENAWRKDFGIEPPFPKAKNEQPAYSNQQFP